MRLGKTLAALLFAGLGCDRTTAQPPVAAPAPPVPPTSCEDAWLQAHALNSFGDKPGTMYMGGTPLFNERTGARTDRLQYLDAKLPALKAACAKDGG